MMVSGQFNAPASLSRAKQLSVSTEQVDGAAQSRSKGDGQDDISTITGNQTFNDRVIQANK